MSKIEVNTIDTQCGSALQIGDGNTATIGLGKSGDTITVPCGATIVNSGTATGFGRTGTVDWDTGSIKTAGFTPVSGNGYFCNTTAGTFAVTLPAGSAGDIVGLSDYASTFDSNKLTVTPNGSDKINGTNDDYDITTEGLAVSLVYVDGTRGWKSVTGSDADATGSSALYVVATGGSPCTGAIVCTNYKVHTFTGPGTLCVSSAGNACGSNTVDYLVVAGGGSGGHCSAGGGGAGGYRIAASTAACSPAYSAPPKANPAGVPVTATPYSITVGGGGAGTPPSPQQNGTKGSDSIFHTITSTGGGYGAAGPGPGVGGPGGSGGGSPGPVAGAGNDPPTSPAQGFNGGNGPGYGAAGGGATAVGTPGASSGGAGNAGGAGDANDIDSSGSPVTYARGGNGDTQPPYSNNNEPDNSGNGSYGSCAGANATGNGGSGIVIIRYKFQ